MKRPPLMILLLGLLAASGSAETILIEAESFTNRGGWVIDQQFMDEMGSPYLLAHGLGVPVKDAVTTVTFPSTGRYRVWVRTLDWVARWGAPGQPGRFQVLLEGTPGMEQPALDRPRGCVEPPADLPNREAFEVEELSRAPLRGRHLLDRVPDDLDAEALAARVAAIGALKFVRVGTDIRVDMVAVDNVSGNADRFKAAVDAASKLDLPMILISEGASQMAAALEACADKKPLIHAARPDNWEDLAKLATEKKCPLAVKVPDLEALVEVDDTGIVRQVESWIEDHFGRSRSVTSVEASSRLQRWLLDPLGRFVARLAEAASRAIAGRKQRQSSTDQSFLSETKHRGPTMPKCSFAHRNRNERQSCRPSKAPPNSLQQPMTASSGTSRESETVSSGP